jgi:hypothetical protein
LKPCKAVRHRRDDLLDPGDGAHRVVLTHENERWAAHIRKARA